MNEDKNYAIFLYSSSSSSAMYTQLPCYTHLLIHNLLFSLSIDSSHMAIWNAFLAPSFLLSLLLSFSHPSSGELVEHLLVERLVRLLAPHREEDVPTNELVHHLAVRGQAVENDVVLVVELDHHVLRLPVHIPGLKVGVT